MRTRSSRRLRLSTSPPTQRTVRCTVSRSRPGASGRFASSPNAMPMPLAPGKAIRLADAAHTAGVGRAHLGDRLAVIAANEAEARTALTAFASGGSHPNIRRGSAVPSGESDVVFFYTGAGAQYPGMGQALYETSPVFREAIDRCDALLGADARGLTLKSVLQADTATTLQFTTSPGPSRRCSPWSMRSPNSGAPGGSSRPPSLGIPWGNTPLRAQPACSRSRMD